MTAFDRALQAVNQLSPEDIPLVMRALLDCYPIDQWPALFNDRDREEVQLLMMWLLLGTADLDWMVETLWVLVEKVVDRADLKTLSALGRLGEWLEGCRQAGEAEG